jgi:hypothetical protein
MEIAMSDSQKYLGRMDHGVTKCRRVVMSRWDQPERSDNAADRKRFIRDVRRSGFIHTIIDRYEGDQFPEWVGESHCDDPACRCRQYLRNKTA